MANIFQRIFLSQNQVIEINQKQAIIKSIPTSLITHNAFSKQNGGVIRHFNVTNDKYTMSLQRIFNPLQPEELQVQYQLYIYKPHQKKYTTEQKRTDKFAQRVYNKVYKIWDKNRRQHVK